MTDVCKKSNFPPSKYFQQHELPPGKPDGYAYEYTRCLTIRAEADVVDREVQQLYTIMDEKDYGGEYPGVPSTEEIWKNVVFELLSAPLVEGRNPFDLKLWKVSRLVFLLQGEFWKFSPTLAPLTTKYKYEEQYFDLRRHFIKPDGELVSANEEEWGLHWKNIPCKCISFFTGEPCPYEFLVAHGFSLNIELVMGPDILPITIDPDVENKGGGHP